MSKVLNFAICRLWLRVKAFRHWHAFVLIRVISTLYLQPGYIHPDEFFQSVEVVSGDFLDTDVHKTWEFSPDTPIRSILLPHLLYVPCFAIIQVLSLMNILELNTNSLLVFSRLSVLMCSLCVDGIVYSMLKLYRGLDIDSAMLVYATSYVTLVFYTRTLSNTIESFLFLALLYCVQKETQRIRRFFIAYPRSKLTQCSRTEKTDSIGIFEWIGKEEMFTIVVCLVAGVFNRPTFFLYAYTPVLYYVFDGSLPQTVADFFTCANMAVRKLWLIALFSIAPALVFIQVDTCYFKDWKDVIDIGELPLLTAITEFVSQFSINNVFAITPLNFIVYNMQSDNLAEHGTHSRFTHFFINQPLLFGTLTLCALFDAVAMITTKSDPSQQRTSMLEHSDTKFWIHVYLVPLILLSLFPHQEVRFIIPLLVPLVILYGHLIFGTKSFFFFKVTWILLNIAGFLFYGVLHQGGVVRSIGYVRDQALNTTETSPIHVIYSHTYMPPRFLFLIKNNGSIVSERERNLRNNPALRMTSAQEINTSEFIPNTKLIVHDLQGAELQTVENNIDGILRPQTKVQEIYLVIPSTLESQLCLDMDRRYRYVFVKQFAGHLSTENLPTASYLRIWSDRGFPCSLCDKEEPCKLHPFHILSPVLALNIYKVKTKQRHVN